MRNKLIAAVLAILMVLPLLPLAGVFSFADSGIMYYDENGEVQYYTGTLSEITPANWGTENQTTWYYLNETFKPYNRLSFRGDVRLILGDNALITFDDLNEPHPVETASYNNRSLTIYAQSKDKNTCGKMILNCFGSEGYRGLGSITINGGNIVSTAIEYYTYWERGKDYMCDMAGLGLYLTYEAPPRFGGGSITINGGYVKAIGSRFSAGIGGSFGSSVQTITINGGEVEAYGGYGAPGIGTGYSCNKKNEECEININGGTVTAVGGDGAPGIGSGFNSENNLTVNITGGVINATAGTDSSKVLPEFQQKYKITEVTSGAGIGAGVLTRGKVTVNISGGTVNATATKGAAIGGAEVVEGQTAVNISGGTINATSVNGAGIGSGYNQRNSSSVAVNITGGVIDASSTSGKGIGDAENQNKTTVRIAGTDIVHHTITASSYNANTVIEGAYKDNEVVGTHRISSPSEAAGKTIRPIAYDYESGNAEGPFIEMTGCERKYLSEFLTDHLPILEDRVVYVVDEDLTVEALWVFGTTVLFLRKTATLTVTDTIIVINENMDGVDAKGNLIIVAEAEDSGKLICGPSTSGAAIGSYYDDYKQKTYETGLIRVYSGTVEAHGGAGYPAIGGKNLEYSQYGGVVKAYGGEGAPGIGLFAGDTTGSASIDLTGGRLIARGGTTAQPMGLGGANASIEVSWRNDTDSYDLDPCVGTVTIANGKEFKYLNSSPVQAATASDFLTGGVFVPHTSTYYIDQTGNKVTVDDYIELTNNGSASSSMTTVDGAWYVCVNDARNPLQIMTIKVSGTMNLILTDGTEMRPDNIVVNPGATLNIYGQYGGTGVLRVYGGQNDSGIGGDIYNPNCGEINIYGGKIIAQASVYTAGIGGAGLSGNGGTISIYGGSVKVTPHDDGNGTLLGVGDGWNQSGAAIHYYGGRIDPGAVRGTVSFHNYFLYEDDGSRVFEDEYDPSRVIVPGLPEAAEYIDENGEEQSTYAYKRLHTDTATLTGTYYVYEDVTLPARPEVSGTATLILKDGVTLTAEKGIGVNEGNTLKIYANSRDEALTGALTAFDPGSSFAGIGGDGSNSGSGSEAVGSGDILIAGGKITATGGLSAAAIGSGGANTYYPLPGGTVTITDGFVTANGQNGPAIGMGSDTVNGTITISGGVITANNQGYAAAIGVGMLDDRNTSLADYTINISGGTVTAKANGYMSRTNIGYAGSGMEINISGGQIDASYAGTWSASGIGFNGNVVRISADDPELSVKYSKIKGAEIVVGEGLSYSDGGAVTTPPDDNKTIVVFLSHFALVTFDPDNGGDTTSVYAAIGGKTTAPADPEAPEGHHFIGWYDDENGGGSAFDFEEDLIPGDVTLTAHYAKNVYTVTFDPDNGEDVFTQQVEYGDCATIPTTLFEKPHTYPGYVWSLPENVASHIAYDFRQPVTGDLTLTISWMYEQVKVYIRDMDGSGEGFTSVNYGECVQMNPNYLIMTHPESLFLGWRKAGADTLFDLNTPITEETMLYAVMAYGKDGRCTATDGTYGNYNEGYANLLDKNVSTKWCISNFSGCFIEFSTADYIVPLGYILTTGADTNVNQSRNPTAWKIFGRNSVADGWTLLTEVTDDTTLGATSSTPYIFLLNNTNAYRFFRVEFNAIGTESDGVFQLSEFAFMTETVTTIPEITVDFDPAEGSGTVDSITALKGDKIILPYADDITPPTGKVFSGWSYGGTIFDEHGEFVVSGDSTVITMTAVYEDAVTVTFVNGSESTDAFGFAMGERISLPGNVFNFTAPAGKVFDCWMDENDDYYYENEPYTVNADVVFTAVWRDASLWEILSQALKNAESGDVLSFVLTDDVVAPTDSDSGLYIPEDVTVTIDLAGHKIDRALTYAVSDGMVFWVDGTLTITDSSSGMTGMITGGDNSDDYGEGGGVYVNDSGTFILQGGTITGNKAVYGGGVESYGAFVMTGGCITDNIAIYGGGGVEMYGSYCSVTLSGSAKIYGNVIAYYDDDEGAYVTDKDSDIGLYNGQILTIGGAFTSDARIGVNVDPDSIFTDGLNGARVFFSNVPDYDVVFDEEGEAYIGEATALSGDINGDGLVDIADVTTLLNILAGSETGIDTSVADLNSDSLIDITDVTVLLNILAGTA